MKYILSAPQIHLTDKSMGLLDRRIRQLSRHIPSRLTAQPLHLSLKQNIARNHLEGTASLHVPGRTLVVKARARTIKQVLSALFEKLHAQIIRYATTHDRSHSQFPDKTTIRKIDPMQIVGS